MQYLYAGRVTLGPNGGQNRTGLGPLRGAFRGGLMPLFSSSESLPLVLMAGCEAHLLEVSVWNNRLMLSTKLNLYKIFVK